MAQYLLPGCCFFACANAVAETPLNAMGRNNKLTCPKPGSIQGSHLGRCRLFLRLDRPGHQTMDYHVAMVDIIGATQPSNAIARLQQNGLDIEIVPHSLSVPFLYQNMIWCDFMRLNHSVRASSVVDTAGRLKKLLCQCPPDWEPAHNQVLLPSLMGSPLTLPLSLGIPPMELVREANLDSCPRNLLLLNSLTLFGQFPTGHSYTVYFESESAIQYSNCQPSDAFQTTCNLPLLGYGLHSVWLYSTNGFLAANVSWVWPRSIQMKLIHAL